MDIEFTNIDSKYVKCKIGLGSSTLESGTMDEKDCVAAAEELLSAVEFLAMKYGWDTIEKLTEVSMGLLSE